MSRLVIHAWFPYLAAERLRRAGDAATGDVPAGVPLVLTGARHGAEIVESVCRLAHRRGLHAGMRLADARALCPELVSRDSDPAADAADLLHLARWARRYCPLTAPEQADSVGTGFVGRGAAVAHAGNGLWLDVAGAANEHGPGGEHELHEHGRLEPPRRVAAEADELAHGRGRAFRRGDAPGAEGNLAALPALGQI